MKRLRDVLVIVALVGGAAQTPWQLSAQEVAPPVAVEPQRMEASTPLAPTQMRAEDAALLLQQMRGPVDVPAPRIVPEPPPAAPNTGGVSRTVSVQPPEVVNTSAQFRFRDVTDRTEPDTPKLSLAERRAAVEAYRQSRVTERSTGR